MTHEDKIIWMKEWATRNNVELDLEGECGFGRECVGILFDNLYPDYEWYDANYERVDTNGDVFVPEDAYHKYPCVAVLGRGENAESQLYDWLKWFDDNGFTVETGDVIRDEPFDTLEIMLSKNKYARMVRKHETPEQI